jgi:DNA-binding NarL/FixJ family response regulator
MAKPSRSNSSPPKRAYQVVIVDDHPMIRDYLALLLVEELGVIVCGQAGNAKDGLEVIQRTQPDLAIIDIRMPGVCGLELVKEVSALGRKTRILVLSMHDEELYADRSMKAGAHGYITKENVASDVVQAIQQVMDGKTYCSPGIKDNGGGQARHLDPSQLKNLTDRELEVFILLGHSKNTREVAADLSLGVSTVETYRSRIKRKLNIRSAAELYLRAGLWVRENGG